MIFVKPTKPSQTGIEEPIMMNYFRDSIQFKMLIKHFNVFINNMESKMKARKSSSNNIILNVKEIIMMFLKYQETLHFNKLKKLIEDLHWNIIQKIILEIKKPIEDLLKFVKHLMH